MPRFALVSLVAVLCFASTACCGRSKPDKTDPAVLLPTTTTTPPEAPVTPPTPTSTTPAPIDASKRPALIAIFEKNKATIAKCQPFHAAMMKAMAAKDTPNMVFNSQKFTGCRRDFVSGLMPKISPLGITEPQAQEEMLTWDNARMKK